MIIAITNLKGGVGKTTISTNLSVALTHIGYDVCIVDTDEQQQSAMEWASCRDGSKKQITVVGLKEKQLETGIFQLAQKYDVVIIDGSPQLDRLANVVLAVSNIVIIPITPSIYDYRGFELFFKRFSDIKEIAEMKGKKMEAYVLLNAIKPNSRVLKDIEEGVKEFDIKRLDTMITDRVAYVDTATTGLGVVEYRDPKAKAEMENLGKEIDNIIKKY
jgi:chromosome partitioning protein